MDRTRSERVERRLAAILAADVVGYSRLMGDDEAGTLAAVKAHRSELIDPKIAEHDGRIVKVTGDGMLVEFPSVVEALACAVEIQRGMRERNSTVPEEQRIEFRVGINLGDVIVESGDIFGDGVNVAARLEGIAEPGGIAVSGTVHHHVGNRLGLHFKDLGERTLKNIEKAVRVLSVSLDGSPPAAGAAPPPPRPPERAQPSIAVLPFVNMSGDESQQYFSDGITEDIITELSRFRQLHVAARSSSFRYRGTEVDMVRAGRELGVQYLVEGSVRRLGGRIRITAQLIDAETGHHVWAERFDRDQEEIFAVQDEVVRTIVGTLTGRLRAAGAERARRKPPASLAAYEYVLRADALPFDDPDAEAEARLLLDKAIEIDPHYARAYALLAAHVSREWWEGGSDAALDRALDLAHRALALDENDYLCQSVLGLIHLNRKAFDLAEHHYRKALELNPNSSTLLAAVGGFYAYLGDSGQALSCLDEAKRLDPFFNPGWYLATLGVTHFAARQYDEAIAALAQPSRTPWARPYLAASYAFSGREEAAAAAAAEVLQNAPDFSLKKFAAIEPYKHEADRERLIEGLRKAGLPE